MNLKEIQFEADIEASLLTNGGWSKAPKTYNRELGMDFTTLLTFLETTQPQAMTKYKVQYGDFYQDKLIKRIEDEIRQNGMLHVLRKGITDRGIQLKLAYFQPETSLNADDQWRYEQNHFHVMRQFKYSSKNENSIDMVLMVNGLPLVALELKNQLTGQSVLDAKRQFKEDRDPKEKVFQFNTRFLVYFAVDLEEVAMTTRLDKEKTYFLPFNQGSNGAGEVGGQGNPAVKDGYQTAYLWEQVLTKDSLMNILRKYMHLNKEVRVNKKTGKRTTQQALIFPRYHQLDVITKLLAEVKEVGSGKNYLIQHSAGSGKSNSIAWLAHRLSSLHNKENQVIFNSVVVVTDRKVLDSQLQDTIYQFDHTPGVVERIDDTMTSKDLKNAIDKGCKIIITTIHKFAEIYDKLEDVNGRRFAIIVDEAHSSQNGKMASNLRHALADSEEALREYAEYEALNEAKAEAEEDEMLANLIKQGQHGNQSFFAFTATPKEKTLQMFGTKQKDGSYRPYHVYSMKQAIEEGFILDVLKNYTTYQTYWNVIDTSPDNPELLEDDAKKRIKRWQSLTEQSIQQKTAIMIDHFRNTTRHKIGGRAKAMIVTQSRLHALRYCFEFKRQIELRGYEDLDVLVAFSGTVPDNGKEYKETDLNKTKDGQTIAESQLPEAFHEDEFSMLIVAEKYQTGFDEPLLHTMFVDKKLRDVKAVQTLSRLNRTCAGKTDTFVLDFVNKKEDIQKAFEPYYEATYLTEEMDVNVVYDTLTKIKEYQIFGEEEIQSFMKIFNKKKQTSKDLGTLQGILKQVKDRHELLDKEDKRQVKTLIRRFIRAYHYVTQMVRLYDEALYQTNIFLTYLDKMLKFEKQEKDNFDLEKHLKLEYLKIKETFSGEIQLEGNHQGLKPQVGSGVKNQDENKELLEEIVNKINLEYGDILDENKLQVVEDLVNNKDLMDNKRLKNAAKRNNLDMFREAFFGKEFFDALIEQQTTRIEAYENIINNETILKAMEKVTAEVLYYRYLEEMAKKK